MRRGKNGNDPLTGPFFVNGAMPGDVLAITIKRLRLNRDWAMSDSSLVARALDAEYAFHNKQTYKEIRWHLNADKQLATLEIHLPAFVTWRCTCA